MRRKNLIWSYLQVTWWCMYKIQKNRQKTSGTKSDLIKVVEYKVNTQKSIIFLYTINKQVEFKIKRIILFIALAFISCTVLKGERGLSWLFLNLGRKDSSFSLLSMMLMVGFFGYSLSSWGSSPLFLIYREFKWSFKLHTLTSVYVCGYITGIYWVKCLS